MLSLISYKSFLQTVLLQRLSTALPQGFVDGTVKVLLTVVGRMILSELVSYREGKKDRHGCINSRNIWHGIRIE